MSEYRVSYDDVERFEDAIAAAIGRDDPNVARAVLAAVLPAHDAELLHTLADEIEATRCGIKSSCHEADALTLRRKAKQIGGGHG